MRRLLILIVIISIGFIVQPASVYACSGPPTPLTWLDELSDYLIYGRIIESDVVRQSHLIQVETYIKGGQGAEYIIINQNSPATTAGLFTGNLGGGDCNYYVPSPAQGEAFYMFVKRFEDGFYGQVGGIFSPDYYQFPTEDSLHSVRLDDPASEDSSITIGQEVNESQFLEIIAEMTGDTPVTSDANAPFPSFQSLLVRSENGTQYVFPIDGGAIVQPDDETLASYFAGYPGHYEIGASYCEHGTIECRAELGASGVANLEIVEQGYSVMLDRFNFGIQSNDLNKVDDVLLSANGVSYALWQGRQLQINYYDPIRLRDGYEVYGSAFSAWSDDGSLFAYSDDSGLWLYSVANADERRLLIETRENAQIPPYALEFSSSGRYLLAHVDGSNMIYDLASGRSIAGDAISPDERYRLDIVDGNLYLRGLLESLEGYVEQDVVKARFLSNEAYLALVCEAENDCVVVQQSFGLPFYPSAEGEAGRDFISSEAHEDWAVLVNDNQIRLNGRLYELELDSPIALLEWIPSRFLDTYPARYMP
jgi:hypothetical protein